MQPCNHCGKELTPETALMSQDLDTTTLAFCSGMCHEMWFYNRFVPLEKAEAAAA